jgi:hypothetical protein
LIRLWWPDRGACWPLVAPDLELAIAESDGELDLSMLHLSLASGRAGLALITSDGRYVGCLVVESSGRYLNVVAARMRYTTQRAFGKVLEILGGMAAERGLQLCCWSRRRGMGRLLERYGWKPRFVEYVAPMNRARVPDMVVSDGG